MQCPVCKLSNPPGAVRCDCGYVFEAKAGGSNLEVVAAELRALARTVESIRRLILIWIVLAVVGTVVYGLISSAGGSRQDKALKELEEVLEKRPGK